VTATNGVGGSAVSVTVPLTVPASEVAAGGTDAGVALVSGSEGATRSAQVLSVLSITVAVEPIDAGELAVNDDEGAVDTGRDDESTSGSDPAAPEEVETTAEVETGWMSLTNWAQTGTIVGGSLLLILVAFATWWFLFGRRRRSRNDNEAHT
jgi:hypothetical protein